MFEFTRQIRPHVEAEIFCACVAEQSDDGAAAFVHLEKAHVLAQRSTRLHVRVHVLMFGWALRHRRPREVWGQIIRIVGAATKTAFGLVPTGNTGGSNISPFRRLPLTDEATGQIEAARRS